MADELFFCGSSARITTILSVDKRQVGQGCTGNITKWIYDFYTDAQIAGVGKYKDWVTMLPKDES